MQKKPIIFGISSSILTEAEKEFFINNSVVGFILFKRNIESKEQLKALVTELKNLYPDYPALIFIDQEGGRVARLNPPIISNLYPTAEFFANIYQEKDAKTAIEAVFANYQNLMADLKEFGIDSPCAPVADLRYSYADKVIGDRSFGYDVERVILLGAGAIGGIKSSGGIPIIKHIPGHGRAMSDSHLALPVVSATLEDLNNTDFKVFRMLGSIVDYAMTAHVIFEALDDKSPITLSKKSINFIRNEIGFDGKIITDAIEMHALHQGVDVKDAKAFTRNLQKVAAKSFQAGCDLILHCTGDLQQMRAIVEVV